MCFGFIKRWVNDPNRKDLQILRKPNIQFIFSGCVCPHTSLSYLCSVYVRMESKGDEHGFGMGMSDPSLV